MQKIFILYENYSDNGPKAREAYSTLERANMGMERWIKAHYPRSEDQKTVRKEKLVYVESVQFDG